MRSVTLAEPKPDFDEMVRVFTGKSEPRKVYQVEAGVDLKVMKEITESSLNRKWVPYKPVDCYMGWEMGPGISWRQIQKEIIEFDYWMGYDCIPVWPRWLNLPPINRRATADTALDTGDDRHWVEEGHGIIRNWKDFERIEWDKITHNLELIEFTQENLPEGMKMITATIMFEMVIERFFGFEDICVLLYDDPKLVEAVFNEWGRVVYNYYKDAIKYPKVGALWHFDDLGHKTATHLGPEFLRKAVFPWFKKYAELAHDNGMTFWLHSCGNLHEVMDDLINDVGMDAFHSFQDEIMPVGDFVKAYGKKVATIGGVDVDKLARMENGDLRKYIRKILGECMPGRFALGSGNSVPNYVPTEKYLVMVEEARNWRG